MSASTASPSLDLDPSILYFAVQFLNTSSTLATWHDFMLTAVEIEEAIYNIAGNISSKPVANFKWLYAPGVPGYPLAINISAIGRGLEPGTPLTFTNSYLMLFTRWMVQVAYQPYANNTFRCSFGLVPQSGQQAEDVPVAEGVFTPYNWTGTYLSSGQSTVGIQNLTTPHLSSGQSVVGTQIS